MRTTIDLVEPSLRILRSGQATSGAFIASPSFPIYNYSWFRDSTFIAQALDLWGDHAHARRFYDWGCRVVVQNEETVRFVATTTPIASVPTQYLHTRYTANGAPGNEEWPNFQLDGFGTFLWGLVQHLQATAALGAPDRWYRAIELLAAYLTCLWQSPAYDCWEEYPDKVHVSTLCALYGGMAAIGRHFDRDDWTDTAERIRSFVIDQSADRGHLSKFRETDEVDASLLWACAPFHMIDAADPVMVRTVQRTERDLVGPHGGVHRYADDSYYGGGAWILLTASLGEYVLLRGDAARAIDILEWIERQASPAGDLPEQVPSDLNRPDMYQPWVERWGPVASPLLWSHAAYLRLKHAIHECEGQRVRGQRG